MKEIMKKMSTNGRWGVAIVSEGIEKIPESPVRATIAPVGTVGGVKTYRIEPTDTQQWVLVAEDAVAHGGATVVVSEGLQSSKVISILLLGKEAVVAHYGYKRRSVEFKAYVNGQEKEIPESVLAAMGLVKSSPLPEVEPPPSLEGAMAEAFKLLS